MTTIKTIKLRRNPASAPAVAPLDDQAPAETQATAAPSETPVVAPIGLEPAGVPASKHSTFTVFAILGICSFIALLAIIGFQAAEWTFYAASPSVWPVK